MPTPSLLGFWGIPNSGWGDPSSVFPPKAAVDAPAPPPPGTTGMNPDDPDGALRAALLATMMPKQGLASRFGTLKVPFQPNVGGQPLSGGQVFLRGLVGGYNGQAQPDFNPKAATALEGLLRLNDTRAYRAGTLANQQARTGLTADNQNPDVKGSTAWGRVTGATDREARNAVLNQVALDADSRGNHSLADRIRHELVDEGQGQQRIRQAAVNERGRNTRHATPSGTSLVGGGTGTGGKGASPFTADNAYYRNLGEQMIAADKAKTGGTNEQSIRSWMNAQLRDLGTVEGNRRRARGEAAADTAPPPEVAADPYEAGAKAAGSAQAALDAGRKRTDWTTAQHQKWVQAVTKVYGSGQ